MTDLVGAVVDRLRDQVTELRSVSGAADLARLIDSGTLPQSRPAAWVIWLGDEASPNRILSGGHGQSCAVALGVVLLSDGGVTAAGNRDVELGELRDQVKAALMGWSPTDDGTFSRLDYVRGRRLGLVKAALIDQLDFRCRSGE